MMKVNLRPLFIALALTLSAFAWSGEDDPMRDETVYVVQPKPMLLSNRFEFILQGTYDLADNYVSEAGMSAQIAYHLRENLAISANGSWLFAQSDARVTNDLIDLKDPNGRPVVTPTNAAIHFVAPYARYYRKPWLASLDVQWTPLLGKISFHDFSLGLFQLFVTAGVGATGLELRDIENNNADIPLDTKWSFATTLGGGFRMYFANHIGLRIEIKDFITPLVARSDLPFLRPAHVGPAPSSFYLGHSPLISAGLSYVF